MTAVTFEKTVEEINVTWNILDLIEDRYSMQCVERILAAWGGLVLLLTLTALSFILVGSFRRPANHEYSFQDVCLIEHLPCDRE